MIEEVFDYQTWLPLLRNTLHMSRILGSFVARSFSRWWMGAPSFSSFPCTRWPHSTWRTSVQCADSGRLSSKPGGQFASSCSSWDFLDKKGLGCPQMGLGMAGSGCKLEKLMGSNALWGFFHLESQGSFPLMVGNRKRKVQRAGMKASRCPKWWYRISESCFEGKWSFCSVQIAQIWRLRFFLAFFSFLFSFFSWLDQV